MTPNLRSDVSGGPHASSDTAPQAGPPVAPPPAASYADALAFFQGLIRYGEVYELRVPGHATAYVAEPEAATRWAVKLSDANVAAHSPASGIYVTLNPVDPALAGERLNTEPAIAPSAATDADVLRRRHLLIDVDPKRQEAGSATDAERHRAIATRDAVRADLAGAGWPEPLAVTMSGNGGGLIYRLNLPNDEASTQAIEALLRSLSSRFGTDHVSVDTTVSNASRITKIPGTVACKGAHTDARPWRRATAEIYAEAGLVDRALLRRATGQDAEPAEGTVEPDAHAEPVREALRDVGITWGERRKGTKLYLDLGRCPTGEHPKTSPTDTTIFVGADGRLGFKCQHDTCQGRTWADARIALGLGASSTGGADQSQSQVLLKLAETAQLFHTPEGVQYATFAVNDHRECWPVTSKGFRRWLTRAFYHRHAKPPSREALQSALGVLESQAQFDGPTMTAYTRIAEHDGRVYLDLANDRWEAVEIDAVGWRVITDPPVHFRRPRGMAPLPTPLAGGTVDDLSRFLNLEDDDAFTLVIGWLLGAFRPRGPYPVLGLHGEPGAAKSTTARVLRALIDPNAAGIRSMPRTEDDLIIGAVNGWLPIFDNLSYVSEWVSDALCRLSTGGGYSKRELYSDLDETIVDVMRPVVLTGIGNLAAKPDLLDRSILVDLPVITDDRRLEEDEFWPQFEEERPWILGALLDAVSAALRDRDSVRLMSRPRMADFARWIVAAGSALGWETGQFLRVYQANRSRAVQQSLEVSPLVPALEDLMAQRTEAWEGTPGELLEELTSSVSDNVARQKHWPKAPHVLGTRLRELAGSLRRVGYEIEFGKSGRRTITIARAGDPVQ